MDAAQLNSDIRFQLPKDIIMNTISGAASTPLYRGRFDMHEPAAAYIHRLAEAGYDVTTLTHYQLDIRFCGHYDQSLPALRALLNASFQDYEAVEALVGYGAAVPESSLEYVSEKMATFYRAAAARRAAQEAITNLPDALGIKLFDRG